MNRVKCEKNLENGQNAAKNPRLFFCKIFFCALSRPFLMVLKKYAYSGKRIADFWPGAGIQTHRRIRAGENLSFMADGTLFSERTEI